MNTMLSEHFSVAELACKHCGQIHIDMRLVGALEQLRLAVNKPLVILSGYRCAEHNAAVGGAKASEHVLGRAADVAVPPGLTLAEFYEAVQAVPAFASSGIGLYKQENFIHMDVGRTHAARWSRNAAGQYVGIGDALA